MPGYLPDAVQQSMGWQPQQLPGSGVGAPSSFGGLDPSVMQAMGIGQPPSAPEAPPPPASIANLPPLAPYTPPTIPGMGPEAQGVPMAPPPTDAAVQGRDYAAPAPGSPLVRSTPTPPARPPTPDQLAMEARTAQQHADQSAQSANVEATRAGVGEAQAQVANYAANADQAKAFQAEQKQIGDEYQKTYATKSQQLEAIRKQGDDYKIDRDKYWKDAGVGGHLGWQIGLMLSHIGEAMQGNHGPNPVLQMLQAKMKESVESQMDERDRLVGKGNRAEHDLDKYTAFTRDRQATISARLGELDHSLAREVMSTAAQYKAPDVLAKGQQIAAQLEESSAAHLGMSAKQAAEYDMQKQQMGLQRQQVGIAGGHLALARQSEARAQKLQDLEWGPGGIKEQELGLKAAAEMRKSMQEKKDKAASEGLFNPTTAEPFYNENGKKLIQQADQLEVAGRNDPANAQQYADQAAQLRLGAKSEVVTLPDKEDRRKVMEGMQYGQDLINATGEIKKFLASDPDITNREGWAKVQALYGDAKARYIESIGARASSREFEAISDHILKYDPDSLIDRTFRKAPGKAALEGLEQAVKGGVDSMLKTRGVTEGWVPKSPLDSPATTLGARTGDEAAAAAEPSNAQKFAGRALDTLGQVATGSGLPVNVFSPAPGQEWDAQTAARAASDAANPTPYGLPRETDAKLHALMQQAEVGNNAKRNQIIEQIVDPIKKNDRPSLSMGLLRTIKDEDPKLYEDVMARLPPMQAAEIRKYDTPIKALEPTGTNPRPSTIQSVEEAKRRAAEIELNAMKNRR